nr:N-acetylneuraminate synthase family protein [Salinispira pacifica]
MLKTLELSFEEHKKLAAYCIQKGIDYCSTPFDEESFQLLVDINVPFWKVPSGEITNVPYLRMIAQHKKPIILSTGMAEMYEIAFALKTLEDEGVDSNDVTVLHCNTEYPTPMSDVNLLAMNSIKNGFKVNVGYSDHTLGIEIPIAAAALGATVIEKHFTLNKSLPGPDHAASLEPSELNDMVKSVRNIEAALGSGRKIPSASEQKNRPAARKSVVAKTSIKKGEQFSTDNITVKRPGTGVSPIHWDQVIGSLASRDYKKDELI